MAYSAASAERRANLIREMARQNGRHSAPSSVASGHDSVRDYGLTESASQQLPQPRASTNRYTTNSKPEPDFQVNSSALRRAFPNFSQAGSSEEDSIEFGRAARKSTRDTPNKMLLSEDITENIPFTLDNGSTYQITATPPIRSRELVGKAMSTWQDNSKKAHGTKRGPSNKENEDPLTTSKGQAFGVRKNGVQHEQNRLAELQAAIGSEDERIAVNRRPLMSSVTTKNTRFGGGKGLPKAFTSTNALLEDELHRNSNGLLATQPAHVGISNPAGNATYQSFILPDLPNITELVSGVRQDGTPIFTRSVNSRSKLGSTPKRRTSSKPAHVPIGGLPIPTDEKALFVSLKLLQEKVDGLETEKAESQKKMDGYESEIADLKSRLQQRNASGERDSGIGSDADEGRVQDVVTDKKRLELSIRTLQDRLDRANRKVSISEITVKTLTKDRDAAHSQLAVAYLNSEELQGECENLRRDIEKLNAQLSKLTKQHQKKIDKLTKQETELRGKIERREKAVKEMSSLAKELWNTRTALAASSHPQTKSSGQSKPSRTTSGPDLRRENKEVDQLRRSSRFSRRQSLPVENSDAESTTNIIPTDRLHLINELRLEDLTKDSTYASFMEGDEIGKLKRILEVDRARLAGVQTEPKHGQGKSQSFSLPRKSSLKDLSRKIEDDRARRVQQLFDEVHQSNAAVDNGIAQQSNVDEPAHRRRRSSASRRAAEMTSAFILPDITLSGNALAYPPQSSESQAQNKKFTMTVPRPTPVTSRPLPHHEDHTLRPAQSPALALATVLHELEEEVSQLRTQLAEQEKLYNQHDPALERRKRKTVYATIQNLLAAIEIRSERIYRLYDVLEGQKASGMLMTDEEVEVTLRDAGIDPAAINLNGKEGAARRSKKTVIITEDDDESAGEPEPEFPGDGYETEEELPWEGIEATTQSLRGLRVH